MDVVRLTPSLVFLRFPVGHVYLWHDDSGVTVIDTGLPGTAASLADAVHRIGHGLGDVRQVILTHAHEDHVGSAADVAAWGDVAVLAHHADAPVVRGEQPGPPPVLSGWEQELWDQVHAGVPDRPVVPVRVDRELHDGDDVDVGGGAVVIAVPGHTPGSLALHLPRERILFTGDTIARTPEGSVILGVFNADPAGAVRSFHAQAGLDVELACFGHGEPLVGGASRRLRDAARAL